MTLSIHFSRCKGAAVAERKRTAGPVTLADKLDRLFQVAAQTEGREVSHQQVASEVEAAGGPTISATYLWQLRRGSRDNPTKAHLEALAAYFEVPVAYFFDDARDEAVIADVELRAAVRDDRVRRIALRAAALPGDSLDSILQIVEVMRGVHGLPVAASSGHAPTGRSRRMPGGRTAPPRR